MQVQYIQYTTRHYGAGWDETCRVAGLCVISCAVQQLDKRRRRWAPTGRKNARALVLFCGNVDSNNGGVQTVLSVKHLRVKTNVL